MKSGLIGGLLVSFAGSIAACGAVAEGEPKTDPPVVVDAEAGPAIDSGVDAPSKPTSCSAPVVDPKCTTTTAAPTTDADITKFVKDNAIPLRCDNGGDAVWDLRPLVDLYGAQKIFMMGEVHGTNEIGIVSSLLFEQLASKKLVNVVAFEMPMDVEPAFQRYVDTGKDAMAEQFLKRQAKNFFGTILTKTARELATKGIAVRVGAVDIPYDPATAVTAIQEVATKLTTQKDAVLATLPTSTEQPPSASDVDKANTYFDHIMSKKAEICVELSAADCDRLVAMTHALWAATLADDRGDSQEWFARREEVIYYNLKSKMAAPTDRMFLHMGAAHTNKHEFSGGSRMAKEYALTKGQVFSVAPAYGDGSVIWYGQDMDLPGDPQTIVSALGDAPDHPFFVSSNRPSQSCQKNPIETEPEDTVGVGGTRGEVYDGYIHYGKLTSERRPGDTKLSRDTDVAGAAGAAGAAVERAIAFRARIEQREREAIAAGALSRMRR